MEQITVEELKRKAEPYLVVDIRDEIAFSYGSISGAINIPQSRLEEDYSVLPKDKHKKSRISLSFLINLSIGSLFKK